MPSKLSVVIPTHNNPPRPLGNQAATLRRLLRKVRVVTPIPATGLRRHIHHPPTRPPISPSDLFVHAPK